MSRADRSVDDGEDEEEDDDELEEEEGEYEGAVSAQGGNVKQHNLR